MEELEGIAVSAALLLRLFEHIHETPELEDKDLHEIVEIMNYMSMDVEGTLDVDDYDEIIGNEEEMSIDDVFESFLEEKMKDDPCWDGYEMVGQKEKNGRKVPNCVPKK